MTPWEVLGLEDGESDRAVIRSAYVVKLRAHRPDEDPEGFRRVRDAYEFLKSYADHRRDEDEDSEYEYDDEYGDGARDAASKHEHDVEFHELLERDDLTASEHASHGDPSFRDTRPREPEVDKNLAAAPAPRDELPLPESESPIPNAIHQYFTGSNEELSALVWKLTEADDTEALAEIASGLERRAHEGLPRGGEFLALELATIWAPIDFERALALSEVVYNSMPPDERPDWKFAGIDEVKAVLDERLYLDENARHGMARIIARGGWEGEPTLTVSALLKAKVARDGALHEWLKRHAPDLEDYIRFKSKKSRHKPIDTAEGSIGCGGWFVRIWLIWVLMRACTAMGNESNENYGVDDNSHYERLEKLRRGLDPTEPERPK